MSELDQILQYEEQKKEDIVQARQEAQEAIQKKQEQLRRKIAAAVGLSASETQEIIQKAQAQTKELEGFYQQQQKNELGNLLKKKSANFEQAVNFVVANFQAFNT